MKSEDRTAPPRRDDPRQFPLRPYRGWQAAEWTERPPPGSPGHLSQSDWKERMKDSRPGRMLVWPEGTEESGEQDHAFKSTLPPAIPIAPLHPG